LSATPTALSTYHKNQKSDSVLSDESNSVEKGMPSIQFYKNRLLQNVQFSDEKPKDHVKNVGAPYST
jgi:hypothetical protein